MVAPEPLVEAPVIKGLKFDDVIALDKAERKRVYEQLAIALSDPSNINMERVRQLLRRLHRFYETVATNAMISGAYAPFQPKTHDLPRGQAKFRPEPLKVIQAGLQPLEKVRQIDISPQSFKAIEWLQNQFNVKPEMVAGIISRAQVEAGTQGLKIDQRTIDDINQALLESQELGEGRTEWKNRIGRVIESRAGFDETIGRTVAHNAFHQGQREVLSDPQIIDIFPYRQYLSTMDNRVRDTHAAMNRKVYHKDSQLARQAEELLGEWNCRCSEVPMTEEDAMRIGVSPGGENPNPSPLQAEAKPVSEELEPVAVAPGKNKYFTEEEIAIRIQEIVDRERRIAQNQSDLGAGDKVQRPKVEIFTDRLERNLGEETKPLIPELAKADKDARALEQQRAEKIQSDPDIAKPYDVLAERQKRVAPSVEDEDRIKNDILQTIESLQEETGFRARISDVRDVIENLYGDDVTPEVFDRLIKEIATQNGGRFRITSVSDLRDLSSYELSRSVPSGNQVYAYVDDMEVYRKIDDLARGVVREARKDLPFTVSLSTEEILGRGVNQVFGRFARRALREATTQLSIQPLVEIQG